MILEHPLRDDERAFLDRVATFARDEVLPHADQWDHDEQLPREIFNRAGEIGMMGMIAPKEFGGQAVSYVAAALAIKELGKAYAALAMDIAAHNALAVGQINQFGTAEQKNNYLPRLTSGEWIGAWALTEPNAGSDTGGIETKATQEGDGWRINGLKKFITSGRTAELLVVMATTGQTDKGKNEISAFITRKDEVTPVRKIHTYGMRASDTAELRFENSRAELLGERARGREQALTVLDRGRIGIAALAVGIAEAAFERANSYANERKQFGHAIGDFQAVQWMLVDSAMELEAAEVMTLHAAYLQDQGENSTKESAMAKLFSSESAVKICDRSMQIHGGYGYSRDLPIERYLRDAKLCEIGEGTSQVQRLVIARHVLKEAKPLKLAHREPREPNR
ncbi:MAG TPA: acyl-CoA dehydrogenase family protein [Chthoniobacterales bacterium]|nr:acyl-CoA dehydrogenase family protein [Chthoniobacterales bacterium]